MSKERYQFGTRWKKRFHTPEWRSVDPPEGLWDDFCMTKRYKIRSEVVPYPGMAAWFFAYVDKKQAAEIKRIRQLADTKAKRGFGSIPVTATLGKTKWKTSIFPDKQSDTYVLPLKASVRRAERIDAGDVINFILKI